MCSHDAYSEVDAKTLKEPLWKQGSERGEKEPFLGLFSPTKKLNRPWPAAPAYTRGLMSPDVETLPTVCPQSSKRAHAQGFWEMGFKYSRTVASVKPHLVWELTFSGTLGGVKGQMESECGPTLDKWESCFLFHLSFGASRMNPWACLCGHIHVSASYTCGFSLDS